MILRYSNIMKNKYLPTEPERALKRLPYELGFCAISFFICFIWDIIDNGFICALKQLIHPASLILFGIILFIAGCVYLRALLFVWSFNRAYKKGRHFIGCPIVKFERKKSYSRYVDFRSRALVSIPYQGEVYTPFYDTKCSTSSFNYCDVYFYKKKFYFCAFRPNNF